MGDVGSRDIQYFYASKYHTVCRRAGSRARTGGGETGAAAVMSLASNTELGEWIKPRVCQKVPCPS